MATGSHHGHALEVTVVGCINLRDAEFITRQDPFVTLEYGCNTFRTKVCKDGDKNPSFQEKFVFALVEGLREINVSVWNYHHLRPDELLASGKVQLDKVLTQGFDDSAWRLQSRLGHITGKLLIPIIHRHERYAGEIKLIMYYRNANSQTSQALQPMSVPPAGYPPAPNSSAQYSFHPPY